jgi:hypothetical protein
MTDLYAIRELEFIKQADGTLEAEGPMGKYHVFPPTNELPWGWFAGGSNYDTDSEEEAIAACNAHNAAEIATWLVRVPVVEELRRLEHEFEDGPGEHDFYTADVLGTIADKLERGESLIESEANDE